MKNSFSLILWKSKTRVTSYEFKSMSCEFKSTSYEFKSMSYEFKFTSQGTKSTSCKIKTTSWEIKCTSQEIKSTSLSNKTSSQIVNIRGKRENSEFKILNFKSYKKSYFNCLANAELKPHTKVLKNLFHNMEKHI